MAFFTNITLTLLLVALFSLTISATTITTITTTIVDENTSKCTQTIEPMQQLRHCMMYISPKISLMNAQEEHKEECCSQFRKINKSCRCMAIKEMVRQQQQGQMESEDR
ncbi:AAI domain-containing protein [Heracleum sosnowskyi]|uniref:AAI domain-containing protein n=1 Tax=Heracleum sosnowskyi TaxID=360622 RepID=A0AAD8ITH5_9APIA|nr:AAI domain-containing protein [Heracleum sosnowskyi]